MSTYDEIINVSVDLFNGNDKFAVIHFSQNKIVNPPVTTVQSLPSFKMTDFSRNQIKSLPKFLLSQRNTINVMNFFDNYLRIIDTRLFTGLKDLKVIDSSNNDCVNFQTLQDVRLRDESRALRKLQRRINVNREIIINYQKKIVNLNLRRLFFGRKIY